MKKFISHCRTAIAVAMAFFNVAAQSEGNFYETRSLEVPCTQGSPLSVTFDQAYRGSLAGNLRCMSNLGSFYTLGAGTPQNYREAARWLLKVAEAGDDATMWELGDLYYAGGYGLQRNLVEAARWYRAGALAGNRQSMGRFARSLRRGQGVRQNLALARQWERAANGGPIPSGGPAQPQSASRVNPAATPNRAGSPPTAQQFQTSEVPFDLACEALSGSPLSGSGQYMRFPVNLRIGKVCVPNPIELSTDPNKLVSCMFTHDLGRNGSSVRSDFITLMDTDALQFRIRTDVLVMRMALILPSPRQDYAFQCRKVAFSGSY